MDDLMLTDKRYREQTQFWEKQFSNADIVFSKNLKNNCEESVCIDIELSTFFTEFVSKIAADDLGKFTIVLSMVTVVLNRYTQTGTLLMLTPSLLAAQNQQIIPILILISEDQSLRSLVMEMKSVLEKSYSNADIPIGYYLEKYLKTDLGKLESIFVKCDRIHSNAEIPVGTDLHVNIELSEKINIQLKCNDGNELGKILDDVEAQVHRVSDSFSNLSQSISVIQAISEKEKNQVLFDFNVSSSIDFETKNIVELFEEQVKNTPHHVAVGTDSQCLTYLELDQKSSGLANYLMRQCTILPDQPIAIIASRSQQLIIGMLAILKTGAAYLPIDPTYPKERIGFMISDSDTRILLTESAFKHLVRDFQGFSFEIDTKFELPPASFLEEKKYSKPNNLAYIIYTSGSTGRPKGVMIEQHSLINLCDWHKTEFDVNEKSRATMYAGIGFDASTWEIWPYLLAGATLVPVPDAIRPDAMQLMAYFAKMDITHTFLPTKIAEQVMEMDIDLHDLHILTGGEKLNIRSLKRDHITNNYGPTESTVVATSRKLNRHSDEDGSNIGRPIANTRIYILDKNLKLCPVGVAGEICIAGAGLALGYLNQPELTTEKFIYAGFLANERLYRTGDIGKWLPDGNIHFMGRNDNQVKIRGYRIETGEIEAVLRENDAVRQPVVVVLEHPEKGNFLVANVTLKPGKQQTNRELKQFLAERIPGYMIPSYFRIVDEIPFTPNGKIDRKLLSNLANFRFDGGDVIISPRNYAELRLAEIWKKILVREEISMDADFFELGGHSMEAVRVVAGIEKEFGLTLSVSTLFQTPTIEQLSKLIAAKSNLTLASSTLVPLQPKGEKPPLFFIHPIGGDVFCYSDLAKCLGNDQPFYGLQCQSFIAQEDDFETITEIAKRYIDLILKKNPHGPFHIGGWSLGGLIAFEMACQLELRSVFAASLTMIDTAHPDLCRVDDAGDHLNNSYEMLPLPHDENSRKKCIAHFRAMNAYHPPKIVTPVNLFLCAQNDENDITEKRSHWQKLCTGHFRVHMVEADHYAMMQVPVVQKISDQLKEILK
jgi:amino acid adenylation domain-containing protein